MKLDEIYDIFITTYTQIHMFYKSNIINFDLIIHDVINEERYLFVIKKNNIAMLTHRNNKNK